MKHLIDRVPPGNWALAEAVCIRESNFCYAYTDTQHICCCALVCWPDLQLEYVHNFSYFP